MRKRTAIKAMTVPTSEAENCKDRRGIDPDCTEWISPIIFKLELSVRFERRNYQYGEI
ncbi:hypothetical protein [Holdemania massiliensis]